MGVRLAQAIFDLPEQNNLFLVYSLCAQSIDQLMDWFTHSLVSRCMEHMFCSHQVGYKVKRKLMYTVSGQLKDLATNKYGSHVLEKAWTVMDLKQKVRKQKANLNHTCYSILDCSSRGVVSTSVGARGE